MYNLHDKDKAKNPGPNAQPTKKTEALLVWDDSELIINKIFAKFYPESKSKKEKKPKEWGLNSPEIVLTKDSKVLKKLRKEAQLAEICVEKNMKRNYDYYEKVSKIYSDYDEKLRKSNHHPNKQVAEVANRSKPEPYVSELKIDKLDKCLTGQDKLGKHKTELNKYGQVEDELARSSIKPVLNKKYKQYKRHIQYNQSNKEAYALADSASIYTSNLSNKDSVGVLAEHNIIEQTGAKLASQDKKPPFLFLIKDKLRQIKEKSLTINNYTNLQKHFIPSYKEWCHSIYAYNRETIKKLPAFEKAASKLIKGYFNLYDISKEKNARSIRARVKSRRHTQKRVITSKLNFKHTNEKVTIITHVYNRRQKYLVNSINAIPTVDQMVTRNYNSFIGIIKPKILILKNYINMSNDIAFIKDLTSKPEKYASILNRSKNVKKICKHNKLIYKIFNSNAKLKKIFNNNTKLRAIISDSNALNKILKLYGPTINFFNRKNLITSLDWHQLLIRTVKRFFYKEMQSFSLKQLNFIERSKFNKSLLLPLINLLEIVFRKKVEFSFINAKYIYNSASILGESVVNKLKNRRLRPLIVLNKLFNMIQLPTQKKFILFGKVYYNKYLLQNITLQDMEIDTPVSPRLYAEQVTTMDTLNNVKNEPEININKISNLDPLEQLICSADNKMTSSYHYENSNHNVNKVFTGLKYKFLTGLRVEAAGRLTKRNTAERAVSKSKYIGNLKNTDSSFKGLPATMIKGFEKSSVQYSFLSSKIRTGSYGVKSWVNAN